MHACRRRADAYPSADADRRSQTQHPRTSRARALFHTAADADSSAVSHSSADDWNAYACGERAVACPWRVRDTLGHIRAGSTAIRIVRAWCLGHAGTSGVSDALEHANRHSATLAAAAQAFATRGAALRPLVVRRGPLFVQDAHKHDIAVRTVLVDVTA